MRATAANSRFTVTLTGALLLFLGATILANAGSVTVFVVRLTGFACAIFGGVGLASRVLRASERDAVPFEELLLAGVFLLAGMVISLYPKVFANMLFSLLGVLVVFSGLGDIARAKAKTADEEQEHTVALRIGVATVAAGAFVALVPSAAMRVLPIVCGLVLIVDGLSELYLALTME